MKKLYSFLAVIGIQLALYGCSSQTVADKTVQAQSETQRLMIVSSGNPSEVLPSFTTFTWSEQYNQVLSGIAGQNQQQLKDYIRNQITTYLSSKGYQYRADPKQADMVIGFLFALEDDIADQTIQQRFGLLPGLTRNNVNDPRYEKGSLLLAALDNKEQVVYWRSAVQGFVDLEQDRLESGSARMQYILSMMLGGFPSAGQ